MSIHEPSRLVPSLLAALASVPDPRDRRGRRYTLASVLTFVTCGMLTGERTLSAVARWGGECGSVEVRRTLAITRDSTPSAATLTRLFHTLDVSAYEAALVAWAAAQGVPTDLAASPTRRSLRGIHGEMIPGAQIAAAFARAAARAWRLHHPSDAATRERSE